MTVRIFSRVSRWDIRNERYLLKRQKTDRVYRYWRCRDITDQGGTPHCVGHAWHHLLACAPRPWNVPAKSIYDLAQRCDDWEGEAYDGTSNLGAAQALRWAGIIERYEWILTATSLKNALLTRGPVVLGLEWRAGMDDPDAEGYIYPTGEVLGGHAILCTAYDGRYGDGGVFQLLQSWNKSWGDGGYCWAHFDDMQAMFAGATTDAVYASRPKRFGAFSRSLRLAA